MNYARGSILPFARGSKPTPTSKGFVGTLVQAVANITTVQTELLQDHFRLGHYDIRKTQNIFKRDEHGNSALNCICPQISTCKVPMCRACMFGKVIIQSLDSKISLNNIEHTNVIKNNDLDPGVRISTDQYICRIRVDYHTQGGVKTLKKCTQKVFFGSWIQINYKL